MTPTHEFDDGADYPGGAEKAVSQPVDEETGRFACTKEHPMPLEHSGQWIHRDAKTDDRNDPYYDHYRCPHCGHHFACEVAE